MYTNHKCKFYLFLTRSVSRGQNRLFALLFNSALSPTIILWERDNRYKPFSLPDVQEGVYVYGLFLDGAGWNKKLRELQESPHKIIFTEMPVIHIYAINLTMTKPSEGYHCPVYKKPKRTGLTYVCELCLNTPRSIAATNWILRGVALLCDIK